MTDQLSKAVWLKHGLHVLANEGFSFLKAAPLATSLSVSRGSFYWHFKDIAVFRKDVLELWRETTTLRVIADLDTISTPKERLRTLIVRATQADLRLERAIRAWAIQESDVAKVVESVDLERINYIKQQLLSESMPNEKAQSRAQILYWAYLGQNMTKAGTDDTANARAFNTLFDLILS